MVVEYGVQSHAQRNTFGVNHRTTGAIGTTLKTEPLEDTGPRSACRQLEEDVAAIKVNKESSGLNNRYQKTE